MFTAMSTPSGRRANRIARRRFLALAGTAGAATTLAAGGTLAATTRTATATATPTAATRGGLSFAVVTDTHANPTVPDRMAWMGTVFESIAARQPAFVLNCGDITEYAGDEEYDAYLATIPDALRPVVRHVPGNHETRWDTYAKQRYDELFGPTPYSFDVGGLHVVGLDPTDLLQEPGRFGAAHLEWLERDLDNAGRVPSLMFLHFPMGGDNYYVNDQSDFFDTVAPYPLRGVFAGHVHTQRVHRMNGFTQIAADDLKSEPLYYWVERQDDNGHPVLRVWVVRLAADGTENRTEVTTIALSGDGEGAMLRPTRIDLASPQAGQTGVTVRLRDDAPATAVRVQLEPEEVFGATKPGAWVQLTNVEGTSRWTGSVDLGGVVPGRHQLRVHALDATGAIGDDSAPFELPVAANGPAVAWQERLDGPVQGALAVHDGLVVAATTTGQVIAFRPSTQGKTTIWKTGLGAIYRSVAFDAAGRTVYVGSADHRLTALSASDGRVKWRYDAGEPVLSSPLVTEIDGRETVLCTAGTTVHAVAADDGTPIWTADLHGRFAGRVACDGERVYTGGGDGNAYAFDARTGEELWTFSTTDRTTAYVRLIYGPWDDVVELLPNGLVLVSTVTNAFALDVATGAQRWAVQGSFVYAPAVLLDAGLLLTDEWGKARLVDPATGATSWTTAVVPRSLNAGPVVVGDTGWLVGTTGRLAGFDIATGTVRHSTQLGSAWTYSTPVVVDGVLVTADQAGVLRGVRLP